jgi:hypothetical protein
MKKLLFIIVIFISGLFLSTTSYAAQCEGSIQKRIDTLMEEDFAKKFSEVLSSPQNKSDSVGATMNYVRVLKCELEKICEAIEKGGPIEMYNTGKWSSVEKKCNGSKGCFTLPEVQYSGCKSVYNAEQLLYSREDFEGENAICPSLNTESYGLAVDDTLAFCKERIAVTVNQSKTMVKTGYQQASKQDDGNYYSAKLLSLTERLKELGDKLHTVAVQIQAVFKQVCGC